MAVYVSDDRQRPQRRGDGAVGKQGRLDLALDELNRGQDKRGEEASKGTRQPEDGDRQPLAAGAQACAMERLAADALKEEEAARLGGRAGQGGADASVQAQQAVGLYGLSEAVEGALVSQRQVVGLALQPDLDGVEGVFDVLADDAGDLGNLAGSAAGQTSTPAMGVGHTDP